MEIIVGKTSGFCFGVRNAVEKALEIVKKENNVYCLGELTHNKQVMEQIEKSGAKVAETIEEIPENSTIIIRAHGVSPKVYEQAKQKNLKIVDLTCPRVLKIHEQAEEYKEKGYYIFLVAEAIHPEAIGTIGFCGENATIIENKEMIDDAIEKYKQSGQEKLTVLAQTTYSIKKFDEIAEKLKQEIPTIEINKTICNATNLRQQEAEKIAQDVDCMVIIGGKNSSNTRKLHELSSNYCEKSILIETKDDLNKDEVSQHKKIGIMAGASTPQQSIDDVVEFLSGE